MQVAYAMVDGRNRRGELRRVTAFLTVEADTRYERADQAAFSEVLTRTDQGKHERVTGEYSEATGAVRRRANGGGSFGVTMKQGYV
jgi:hypothetical protein